MKRILLIPKIKVLNANALSSPYSIGFPAMTAWLGATHALQRQLNSTDYENLQLSSMAVVCHSIDLQTYKGVGDYVHSMVITGNPLIEDKKRKKNDPWNKFVRPPFVEEARCHLTVSLVIECEQMGLIDQDEFTDTVNQLIRGKLKLAGGDILESANAEIIEIDNDASRRKLLRRLMPGHCLVERRELMTQAMEEGQDAIDALLDYLKVSHKSEQNENENITWTSHRKTKGWIVPIATGFHGITELDTAENQRDSDTPHRFAESIVTLGEFVMPYRIDDLDKMLWHSKTDLQNNLYICEQNKPTAEI